MFEPSGFGLNSITKMMLFFVYFLYLLSGFCCLLLCMSIFYLTHHVANVISLFKDKSQTAELWEKLNFGNKDQNVKFRKLMGIKVGRTKESEII